jgi:hypothetical protein
MLGELTIAKPLSNRNKDFPSVEGMPLRIKEASWHERGIFVKP